MTASLYKKYVTDSLTHNVTFSFVEHYPLVVYRFGRSLWFCHLELEKEAISDGRWSENGRCRWQGDFEF